jgi:DNA-binding GntR family transcriptional regulator
MNASKENPVRPVAKIARVTTQLAQMAYNLGPGARMPTFASLCAQTRVSKATLDAALGQLEAQGIYCGARAPGFLSRRNSSAASR